MTFLSIEGRSKVSENLGEVPEVDGAACCSPLRIM